MITFHLIAAASTVKEIGETSSVQKEYRLSLLMVNRANRIQQASGQNSLLLFHIDNFNLREGTSAQTFRKGENEDADKSQAGVRLGMLKD